MTDPDHDTTDDDEPVSSTDDADDEQYEAADDDDRHEYDESPTEGGEGADADRGDRTTSGRDGEREEGFQQDDGFERDDGFEHEDGLEREDGFVNEDAAVNDDPTDRGDVLVRDGRDEGVEPRARPGEPGRSSNDEFGEPPRYFDPVAERSDELPRSPGSTRSEQVGVQSTDERPGLGDRVGGDASTHAGLARARKVGTALDDAVTVPGTSFKIGLDPILGILPGGGDAVAAVGSLYIVLEAARAGVPRGALKKMLALVAVDLVVGSVPLIGVLFDAVWKSNKWNVATFEEHVQGDAR